ncbi:MAG: hypothetical protein JOZ44_15285 [Acidobacteria bacterium]|nr:hypothetical protein [Acidobacteriota bacterium]
MSSRAMLSSLSISVWTARKHDADASEEIAARHGAQADAGRYHKVLLPKEALAEIQKIVSEARQEHYFITLPWDDNGYRVLPAAAYMDHVEKMRTLGKRFSVAVDVLVSRFGTLVDQARTRLGSLFRESDYPTANELRAKFSFETKVLPLPDAGDFRVALGDEEKECIRRQITAAVRASLEVGSRELWFRLYDAVRHMAERLEAYKVSSEGVQHPFRDTVVTNLVKLSDVLPKLNVTNDPELNRLAEQVRNSLLVDPKELRTSELKRAQTAQAAAEIAQRMAGYMAGYLVAEREPMEIA